MLGGALRTGMGYARSGAMYAGAAGMTAHQYLGGLGGVGRATAYGAMAGGAYGAMSQDTGILGGALMGAGVGRYGYAGMRGYRAGSLAGRRFMTAGRAGMGGRGRVGSFAGNIATAGYGGFRQARRDAMRAGRFVGRGMTRAYNRLGGGAFRGFTGV